MPSAVPPPFVMPTEGELSYLRVMTVRSVTVRRPEPCECPPSSDGAKKDPLPEDRARH